VFTIKVDSSLTNNIRIFENKMHQTENDFFTTPGVINNPFFAITASIVDSPCTPIGLYVNNGIKLKDVNLAKNGSGNFYEIPPNGFLGVDSGGVKVAQSSAYNSNYPYEMAIQSGPMLVIDGVINSKFAKDSKNLKNRCAVGTFDTGNDQYLVFAISVNPVSFYQVAQLFLEKFKCFNALMLESGSNCSMHLPSSTGGQPGSSLVVCNYIIIAL
jgi:uncharacterized protein YigE (DUF2233 family)